MTVETPAPLALVDVHGVVADLVVGAEDLFDKRISYDLYEYDFWRQWPDAPTADEFWGRINKEGKRFWANLPCLAAGARLVEELRASGVEWAFCTAAVSSRGSYDGTVKFCRKHFGDCRVIGTTEKYELAGPNRILFDDYTDNVEKFIAAGGVAYTWPQPWNLRSQVDTILDYSKLKAIQGVMG